MVDKIASEITELTLQSSLEKVADPDYCYLLKEAGISPLEKPDHNFHELVTRQHIKIAADGNLSLVDQTKVAVSAKAKQKLLEKVLKDLPGVARWGTTGRYAAAAVPAVGGAAYLKGRSTGKKKGKQELADALMARYKQNRAN